MFFSYCYHIRTILYWCYIHRMPILWELPLRMGCLWYDFWASYSKLIHKKAPFSQNSVVNKKILDKDRMLILFALNQKFIPLSKTVIIIPYFKNWFLVYCRVLRPQNTLFSPLCVPCVARLTNCQLCWKKAQEDQNSCYKDVLKQLLNYYDIDPKEWEDLAKDRPAWRLKVHHRVHQYESVRI